MTETLIQGLNWRYACKKFDANKSLDEKTVDTLVEAFNLTATSYGLQPLKLLVIENQALKNKLVPASYGQEQVKDASHLFVILAQKSMGSEDIESYFENIKNLRNTPEEITAPFKAHLLNWTQDTAQSDMELWARKQTYIALGNLLTACALLEVDSCPMEGFEAAKYDEILNLEDSNFTTSLVLPVGFRHEEDFMASLAKVRKDKSQTVDYIR